MKFWKTPAGKYFELDDNNMHAYGINDYGTEIDENSDDWMCGFIEEYDSWAHLYNVTGYNPLKTTKMERVMWISPTGDCYAAHCHGEMAAWIVRLLFDEEVVDLDDANTMLTENGWIKVSDWMWTFYSESTYWVTQDQYDKLFDWCGEYGLELPDHVIVRGDY